MLIEKHRTHMNDTRRRHTEITKPEIELVVQGQIKNGPAVLPTLLFRAYH